MGRDSRHARGPRVRLEKLPDDLFRHPLAQDPVPPANRSEHVALGQLLRCRPRVDGHLTQVGTGVVRTRRCLPTRSTMHQRLSRCWMCFNVSAATSDRRSPQPSSTASIARSRSPFLVVTSGASSNFWVCWTESQFPTRTPFDLAPFTRVIPAASSGAGSLDGQLADGGDPHVNADRPQPAGLQGDAPSAHGGLDRAGPGLQFVPGKELV